MQLHTYEHVHVQWYSLRGKLVAFTRSNALSGCDLIMRWAGQPSPANIPAHSNATSDKINVKDNSCFIEMRKTRTTPHTE